MVNINRHWCLYSKLEGQFSCVQNGKSSFGFEVCVSSYTYSTKIFKQKINKLGKRQKKKKFLLLSGKLKHFQIFHIIFKCSEIGRTVSQLFPFYVSRASLANNSFMMCKLSSSQWVTVESQTTAQWRKGCALPKWWLPWGKAIYSVYVTPWIII